jgi:hypothetical protein
VFLGDEAHGFSAADYVQCPSILVLLRGLTTFVE